MIEVKTQNASVISMRKLEPWEIRIRRYQESILAIAHKEEEREQEISEPDLKIESGAIHHSA